MNHVYYRDKKVVSVSLRFRRLKETYSCLQRLRKETIVFAEEALIDKMELM
jgi:hypothetical protein